MGCKIKLKELSFKLQSETQLKNSILNLYFFSKTIIVIIKKSKKFLKPNFNKKYFFFLSKSFRTYGKQDNCWKYALLIMFLSIKVLKTIHCFNFFNNYQGKVNLLNK